MTQTAAADRAPRIPARISSVLAPVVLIGGWTVAAHRQPGRFDPVTRTISALAAHGAADRWIMTTALAALGVCHVVTASGLPAARPAGRAVLATGGLATVLVAAFPQPAVGGSAAHTAAAGVAFVALTGWPLLAMRADGIGGLPLTRPASVAATTVLAVVLVWFATQLDAGARLGLSERILAGAQAGWPLLVVAGGLRWSGRMRR